MPALMSKRRSLGALRKHAVYSRLVAAATGFSREFANFSAPRCNQDSTKESVFRWHERCRAEGCVAEHAIYGDQK
jgi:hypothetical protein